MSLRDYYEILQLSRDATPEQVKAAYRAMARKYHPDQNPDPTAVERFKQVAEAYRVLSNPETRLAYDRWGHTPAGSAFAPTTLRRAARRLLAFHPEHDLVEPEHPLKLRE